MDKGKIRIELDKIKLQEVVVKIAYQQTAEDQADDLFNKMDILNEYVHQQLALHGVVGQNEQLLAFCEWLSERDFTCDMTSPDDWVELYLKSK